MVTRQFSSTQKIWYHAVFKDARKCKNVLLGVSISAGAHIEATCRDADVSTPASGPVGGKVRKTGCHARNAILRPKRRTVHESSNLHANKRQATKEGLARTNIIVHQLDSTVKSRVVSSLDYHSEV